ncbi:ribonuclease T2 family protein [Pseudomonas sp. WC1]|uniref:ribonuclease T2 family protein n=1 Tax=Pseudomonas sp. WC1 TaxID=3424772 RepID=UPI003D34DECC
MRLLTAISLLLTTAWASSVMALDANEEAYVDAPPTRFLVYSVTWQPTFCKMRPATAGCDQPPERFMTHGIWPYSESIGDRTNRHPQFCTTSTACKEGDACAMGDGDMKSVLSNERLRMYVTRDPEGMFAHEWKKHGTCSGKTIQSYFQDFIELRKVVSIRGKGDPDYQENQENQKAFDEMVGHAKDFSAVRKVFPANTAFRCYRDANGKQYLHEVFYLVDSQGQPYEQEENLQIGVQCAEQETWIPRGKL